MSEADRKRIASGLRLTLALIVMVSAIVAALTGLIFLLVSRIFDSMAPGTVSDLEWKALRGAVELSKTAELGLLVGDEQTVRLAATDFLATSDVANVLALGEGGQVVFRHGEHDRELAAVFRLAPRTVHPLQTRLAAWAPAEIEGRPVGRVLVAVSTSRLRAGDELRRQILLVAGVGGLIAMLLSVAFVWFYIRPVLRVTHTAFARLEHTTHMALEAARLKAQFLANMSHEIRTPLNAVIGLAELILGLPLALQVRRYAERILSSSRALLSIVDDILDFSKIEAGKYTIVRSPCAPSALVQDVAELFAEQALSKGIDLDHRIAPEVPRLVEADADRIRQVLINLVGNAIKFTEHGEVGIRILAESSSGERVQLRIEVQDSGIGVPEELRDHIFESFAQVDGSLVRKHGGTGLGLSICKQIVLLMGGTIGVQSELGKGSCFWFSLPVQVLDGSLASAPPSHGLTERDDVHAAHAFDEQVQASGTRSSAERSGAAERAHFGGARVLVVDDNEVNQFVAVEQLKRLGCQVEQAHDGQEALEMVLAREYALVLMDGQMPVMDGYTATREIRAREAVDRRTVIVAFTAHALRGEREHALSCGMDDYLTKPFRPHTLQRVLERWIRRAGEPCTARVSEERVAPAENAAVDNVVEGLHDCDTELLELFLQRVPAQLKQLERALAMNEGAQARAQAHKLKGSLLAVSARELAGMAERLQNMAEAPDPSAKEELYTLLLESFSQLERRMQHELAQRARRASGAANH